MQNCDDGEHGIKIRPISAEHQHVSIDIMSMLCTDVSILL